jgi:hypothetical protein
LLHCQHVRRLGFVALPALRSNAFIVSC